MCPFFVGHGRKTMGGAALAELGVSQLHEALWDLNHRVPFIEPLIFLSDENLINKLFITLSCL